MQKFSDKYIRVKVHGDETRLGLNDGAWLNLSQKVGDRLSMYKVRSNVV